MSDTNLLFDSFPVTSKSALGGSGTLFGSSIGSDRTTTSSIINSLNCNNVPCSISGGGGVGVIPSTNNLGFNTGRSPPLDLWRSTSSGGLATIHGLDLSKPPSSSSSPLSVAELIKKENLLADANEHNDGDDDDNNSSSSAAAAATIGLDLSKPELPSPGGYRRSSDFDPSPLTNGVHSDPPTPLGGRHAPSRSMSSGSGGADNGVEDADGNGILHPRSPFGADSVLNDRNAETSFTNGDSAVPLSLSSPLLGSQHERPGYMKSSPKFTDPYSVKAFDESPPPPLKFKDPYGLNNPPPPLFDHTVPKPPPPPSSSSSSSGSSDPLRKSPGGLSSKFKDSCIAARLADNNTFVKPLDAGCYSKLLEGYSHNARANNNNNNNNNNSTSNNNNNNNSPASKPELHDSPFGPIPDSYAKHIENLANGYKSEASPLGKDGLLYKGDASALPPISSSTAPSSSSSSSASSSIVGFCKREGGGISNGIGSSFGGVAKSESGTAPSSAHSPGSNSSSLPSILNFSTNHLRGMSAAEGGLASYLSSYGMGGPLSGSLSGSGSGSGGDSRAPGKMQDIHLV
ncbi:hypothetical protein EGW08_022434 [Elysia chlorotica]|uniref:Uncharacterized protein n=1 Tax=Elysia chlorotica TaxID=188477 RepID=A0A433SKZ6_ELYCH|nr:hypothetical protein EGW08_022434 [Elysia chlorotica]